MIKYRRTKSRNNIRKYLKLALDHKLFIPGWSFQGWYIYWLDLPPQELTKNLESVVMAFENEVPIGICTLSHHYTPNLASFYVKESHRRTGVGTKLFKKMNKENKVCFFRPGIAGSYDFYQSLGSINSNRGWIWIYESTSTK